MRDDWTQAERMRPDLLANSRVAEAEDAGGQGVLQQVSIEQASGDPRHLPASGPRPRRGAEGSCAVETVQLTMSHVGLGSLSESALMVLFGNAHSHRLVANTGSRPDALADRQGVRLYPAYFMTSLKVPNVSLLNSYGLWDEVDIGIDVRRFGETLLESNYVLGRKGAISPDSEDWDPQSCPVMSGCNLIVVDTVEGAGTANRQVAVPRSGCMAPLPKLRTVPAGVARSRQVRTQGFALESSGIPLRNEAPLSYVVRPGADAAPGHAMIFAKFCDIMDFAEREFLARQSQLPLPAQALDHFDVVERETFYYGNCFGGEALSIQLDGSIQLLDWTQFNESSNCVFTAELNLAFEISKSADGSLVSIARVKKLLALPAKSQDVVRDVVRILSRR